MESKLPSKLERSLNLEFSKPEEIWLTNQNTLRKLVGVLGMLLPVLLWLSLYLFSGHTRELESISHYYYTRSNGIFIITVSLLAIFLLIYKGKRADFYLSSAAGIFALALLLFPTDNLLKECEPLCNLAEKNYAIAFIGSSTARVLFHFVSAAIFLLSLAAMSMFLFTRSDTPKAFRPEQKKKRNRVYRTCALVMLTAVLVIFPGSFIIPEQFYDAHHLTFWMEAIAVESFGFSWLVKGQVILKD